MYRRLPPYLVAGVTGVLSGLYIFKPLIEASANRNAGDIGSGSQDGKMNDNVDPKGPSLTDANTEASKRVSH